MRSNPRRPAPVSDDWESAAARFAGAITKSSPESCLEGAAWDESAQREWVAAISSRYRDQLRAENSERIREDHNRGLREWAATLLAPVEVDRRDSRVGRKREPAAPWPLDEQWDPSKHPRRNAPPNRGWFVSTGGGGTLGSALDPSNPAHWYLPSDDKGQWLGAPGESVFRLKTPVDVNGKLVRDIEFKHKLPVLDKFVLPGKTVTVVLTGERRIDVQNAKNAWARLNPGRELPNSATFHHDLLNATVETVTIDGKRVKVVVGKMQLIPTKANQVVFHQGSASVARKFYEGAGIDASVIAKLAKEQALLGDSGHIVSRAIKRIKPGRISKRLLPFIGRSILRALPLIGTGLAIIEFTDNVEAHGLGGAIVRATPVLGDLISAHDLGSDLAQQIRAEAAASLEQAEREINEPVRQAWDEADAQMASAYQRLSPHIKVTNRPVSPGAALVDPQEIVDALMVYRTQMQHANYQRIRNAPGYNFKAEAARYEHELRERLERASQRNGPALPSPSASPVF